MDGEKSILYQLLSLFEGLYPGWVADLKKRPDKKKKVCDAYRRCLVPEITADHINMLLLYLQSTLNEKYRTWPPPPLELIRIFDLHKKKLPPPDPSNLNSHTASNTNSNSITDPDSISFQIAKRFIIEKCRIDEMPENLHPYLQAQLEYKKNPEYVFFLLCNMLYFKLRDLYPQFIVSELVQKMIDPINRLFICQELGVKQFDIAAILNFWKKTRLNEEIFLYLEELEMMQA